MTINGAKWTFLLISLCFQNNLLFALDFFQIPYWNCLELFPFLVHGSFCIRNLHRLWQWDELVHQIIMCHRSDTFSSNEIFMHFELQRFCSLSRGLMRFHQITIHIFEFLFFAIVLCHFGDTRMLHVHPLAWHGWCHRSFQFSSCVSENLRILFVIWINKVNSTQFSSIVKFWLFFCPFLFFLDSARLYQFSSILLAIHNLVWLSFESLSVSPRTTCVLLEASLPKESIL